MAKVKILGISGRRIKDGNCDKMVQEGLKAYTELEETLSLIYRKCSG